jgi:hypothetical protein
LLLFHQSQRDQNKTKNMAEDLPMDVVAEILSKLELDDLPAASNVCMLWHEACKSKHFLIPFAVKLGLEVPPEMTAPNLIRELVRNSFGLRRRWREREYRFYRTSAVFRSAGSSSFVHELVYLVHMLDSAPDQYMIRVWSPVESEHVHSVSITVPQVLAHSRPWVHPISPDTVLVRFHDNPAYQPGHCVLPLYDSAAAFFLPSDFPTITQAAMGASGAILLGRTSSDDVAVMYSAAPFTTWTPLLPIITEHVSPSETWMEAYCATVGTDFALVLLMSLKRDCIMVCVDLPSCAVRWWQSTPLAVAIPPAVSPETGRCAILRARTLEVYNLADGAMLSTVEDVTGHGLDGLVHSAGMWIVQAGGTVHSWDVCTMYKVWEWRRIFSEWKDAYSIIGATDKCLMLSMNRRYGDFEVAMCNCSMDGKTVTQSVVP